jgi:ABC-type transport system involved in multi-copper enzyme maturation permease subunit
MRLGENPVYLHTVRTNWRGWRLYVLPALTVVFLGLTYLLGRWGARAVMALIGPMSTMSHAPLPFNESSLPWFACYSMVAMFMAAGAYLLVPGLSAAVLAREYEAKTFEALRTTGLTDAEIALGKLAGVLLPIALCFLVAAPVAAAAAVTGGVAWWSVALGYPVGAAQTVAHALVALLAAAATKRTLYAVLAAYAMAIVALPLLTIAVSQVPIWVFHWRDIMEISASGAADPWKLDALTLWSQGIPGVLWVLVGLGAWFALKAALRYRP